MTQATNLEGLQKLSEKVTGRPSTADSIADAIAEIADGYSSGGGSGSGVTIVSGQLNVDSSKVIKSASLTMSDGSVINMPLASIDKLTLTSQTGTSEGYVKIIVKESLGKGNSYVYGVDISPSKPAKGEVVSELTAWDGSSEIEAFEGSVVTIVEVDKNKLAIKAGTISL